MFNLGHIIIIIIFIIIIIIGCYKRYIEKKNIQQVNHPSHYQKNGKEFIEVMKDKFGDSTAYWFCILNSFKYKNRAWNKISNAYQQDLAKAKWYKDYADTLSDKESFD